MGQILCINGFSWDFRWWLLLNRSPNCYDLSDTNIIMQLTKDDSYLHPKYSSKEESHVCGCKCHTTQWRQARPVYSRGICHHLTFGVDILLRFHGDINQVLPKYLVFWFLARARLVILHSCPALCSTTISLPDTSHHISLKSSYDAWEHLTKVIS